MRTTSLAIAAILLAFPVRAEPPRVVVDVAPVHSLVAQVMNGIAEPVLLIPANLSPHGHAMKVSQARTLAQAEVVFWVGEALTPWLEKALYTVAGDAESIELLEVESLDLLHFDEDAADHDHEGHEGHEGVDPHIWLDPLNAQRLVEAIAEALSNRDPENAAHYRSNAAAAAVKLDALIAETKAATVAINDRRYIVYHDGYRYYENRFGLGRAVGISDGHAAKPGARRLAEIRLAATEIGARCLFSERQFGSRTVQSIMRGTDMTEAELDPMGQAFEPGPALYAALIRQLTATMAGCLK